MKDFKSFKNQKEVIMNKNDTKLIENSDIKNILKKFVVEKSGLSDNALVNLIVFHNTGKLDEDFVDELNSVGYVVENEITETGIEFINSAETLDRLKAML